MFPALWGPRRSRKHRCRGMIIVFLLHPYHTLVRGPDKHYETLRGLPQRLLLAAASPIRTACLERLERPTACPRTTHLPTSCDAHDQSQGVIGWQTVGSAG